MTPAEIAKLPTPRTDWLYEPRQAALGHIVFNPHVTLEASYTYSRTLEQKLSAAVMALEVLMDIALVTNSNYALDQANRARETLAAIKETDSSAEPKS